MVLYLNILNINTAAVCLVKDMLTSVAQPTRAFSLRLVDVPPSDEILFQVP